MDCKEGGDMLNDIDKKSPFKIPENYFENFNIQMMDKLPEQNKQVKKIPLWRTVTKWSAAAAILASVSLVGINFIESSHTQKKTKEQTENIASLENDYYQFIEDEATQLAYKDSFYQ